MRIVELTRKVLDAKGGDIDGLVRDALSILQDHRHEARAEALEEAAKACDTIANAAEQGGDFFTHCPHRCAISLRALRSGEREG